MNKWYIFFLSIVFLLAFLVRFYKLGEVPAGLYQDETAIGYNAYSLLETGKDEYGKVSPLYFKSFGDYKLPVYIWATVPSVKIFGLSAFAVRFPSALFGFFSVVIFYFFVERLAKDRKTALVATFFLALNPWHIHYSRATFEVSIALFLFLLGAYLLLVYSQRKIVGLFLLGTVCFLISLYTYNLTRLLSPTLYGLCVFYFFRNKGAFLRKEIAITTFCSGIALLPFLTSFFDKGGVSSASGTLLHTSAVIQSSLIELRSYLIDMPPLFSKIFFNIPTLTALEYAKHILSYFSFDFYFLFGSPHGNHGIGNVGQFYLVDAILLLIGIISYIKRPTPWVHFFVYWFVATVLVASLTREAPHATRSFFIIPAGIVMITQGVLFLLNNLKKNRTIVVVLSLFFFYNVVYYFTSYYIRFPLYYAKQWRASDKTLVAYINENEHKYKKVIFDENAGFVYTSYLFYTKFPPQLFQETVKRTPDDSEGFTKVTSFSKYEFKDIHWEEALKEKDTLIITTQERKPKDITPLAFFYFPKRPVVVALKQEVVEFPVEEVSYVVLTQK